MGKEMRIGEIKDLIGKEEDFTDPKNAAMCLLIKKHFLEDGYEEMDETDFTDDDYDDVLEWSEVIDEEEYSKENFSKEDFEELKRLTEKKEKDILLKRIQTETFDNNYLMSLPIEERKKMLDVARDYFLSFTSDVEDEEYDEEKFLEEDKDIQREVNSSLFNMMSFINNKMEIENYYIEKFKREKLKREKMKNISSPKMQVNIDDVINSFEEIVFLLEEIENNKSGNVEVEQEIISVLQHLFSLTEIIFERYNFYDGIDIEKLILVINNLTKNNFENHLSFINLYKDLYIDFVLSYTNRCLKEGETIPHVFEQALDCIFKINSRIIKIIIKEKEEEFSPLKAYLKEAKKLNR